MAILIKADGEITKVEPADGHSFKLTEMQNLIGGYFEAVHVRDGRILLADEDGMRKNLQPNYIATAIVGQQILGDVLICNFKPEEIDNHGYHETERWYWMVKVLEQVKCHVCGSNRMLQKYDGKWICGKCMLRLRFNKKAAANGGCHESNFRS